MLLLLIVAVVVLADSLAYGYNILLEGRVITDASRSDALLPPSPAAGVYIVQFRARIDAVSLRRAATVLGYEPQNYVPRHAVLVYFNSSSIAHRFATVLRARIRRIVPLRATDRQAPIGAMIKQAMRRSQGDYLNGSGLEMKIRRNRSAHAESLSARMSTTDRLRKLFDGKDASSLMSVVALRAHRIGLPMIDDVETSALASRIHAVVQPSCRTPLIATLDNSSNWLTLSNVHCDDAERSADVLVREFDNIVWVEIATTHVPLNRWSIPSVHRAADAERMERPLAAQDGDSWRPLLNLKGDNQVISISDTGLATETCHFTDGQGVAAGQWPHAIGSQVPPDVGHPRIRAYTSGVGGDYDDASGHGTHVVGTALGRAARDTLASAFNGVAPNARLAFYDLMSTSGGLVVPPDIGTDILQWSADCGARVHSASWGSLLGGRYTLDEQSVDRFAWEHRTFLPIFAAGNSGPRAGTIVSPAMAKNIISVGATMNGVKAVELVDQVADRTDDSYSGEWLADFSSRGSDSMPFAKPDVLAPGGSYVWSAAFDAPRSGSCNPTSDTILGIAGTSMATPAVAGIATLIYEALDLDAASSIGSTDESGPTHATTAHEGGSSLVERDGGGGLPVRASLVRAMLAASGRATFGRFPQRPYKSDKERREAEGNGRVALDRVLGSATDTRIMSNERASHALARAGDTARTCISISGLAPDETLDSAELVIQLAYVDYPSTPGTTIGLINDLDLIVMDSSGTALSVNGANAGISERRSTMERVIVRPARAVDVLVRAATLDFGGSQTFSLVAVLRPIDVRDQRMPGSLVFSELRAKAASCTACDNNGISFIHADECAECGNGVLEDGEECEPELSGRECCDENTCKWHVSGALCSVLIGMCRVRGRCEQLTNIDGSLKRGECVPDNNVVYGILRLSEEDGTCQPIDDDSVPDNKVCVRSVKSWLKQLRARGTTIEKSICCEPLDAVAHRRVSAEPLRLALLHEYLAAYLNAVSPGAVVSASQLLTIRDAETLLEQTCGMAGFLTAVTRQRGGEILDRLRTSASSDIVCETVDNGNEYPNSDDICEIDESISPSRSAAQSQLLCSGLPNRYIEEEQQCACSVLRHPGEPNCAHLSCSGNGASVFDYKSNEERCSCLPGWAGAQCGRCEQASGADTRFICIGLPHVMLNIEQRHVRRAVSVDSIRRRLDGSFYAEYSSEPKFSDQLPGSNQLDCACRSSGERVYFAQYASHRDALEAALDSEVEQMDAWARAEPLLMPPPRTTSVRAPRINHAQSVRHMSIHLALASILLSLAVLINTD